jgi:DNA replication and repair protein RecF
MYLSNLSLLNFKNISQADLELSNRVNCFLGDNGQGKTNLLDAIYHLSYTKSFFNSIDSQNVMFDESLYVIQGAVKNEQDEYKLYCGLKKGEKKIFKKNKKIYKKLADHIGFFPVVMITPYDINLILEGGETRRRFFDALIAQFDKNYLLELLQYNKLLKQRNAFLKTNTSSSDLLEVYDDQMIEKAQSIHQSRKNFIDEFKPIFNKFYQDISSNKEVVDLDYQSALHENSMKELFTLNRTKDQLIGHTSSGIHRDDFLFSINRNPLKKFGSQGQQKTYLIALKLAKFEYIKLKKNVNPVLLLDDIFDKLDDHRVGYILNLIEKNNLGQTFITDTSKEKIPQILSNLNIESNLFWIENGNSSKLN